MSNLRLHGRIYAVLRNKYSIIDRFIGKALAYHRRKKARISLEMQALFISRFYIEFLEIKNHDVDDDHHHLNGRLDDDHRYLGDGYRQQDDLMVAYDLLA